MCAYMHAWRLPTRSIAPVRGNMVWHAACPHLGRRDPPPNNMPALWGVRTVPTYVLYGLNI